MPDPILDRVMKGDFTRDVYLGFQQHRRDLHDLMDGSLLVQHGLVDAAAWRRAVTAPHPHYATLMPLEPTVACELWLRAASTREADPHGHETRSARVPD